MELFRVLLHDFYFNTIEERERIEDTNDEKIGLSAQEIKKVKQLHRNSETNVKINAFPSHQLKSKFLYISCYLFHLFP